ncbi:class I SAM-dependent methyltransferase [Candidatus Woesearchaeota archaeon]|nr:class I SAM-dependent methyltransferase [Candidatus Woesearchaeota archaeon]
MVLKLDKFYVAQDVKKKYKVRYDKKNKKRPSWIQVDAPKGTDWIQVIVNGEAFWYRTYFRNYYFPMKHTPEDFENYYDEISSFYEEIVPHSVEQAEKIISLLKRFKVKKDVEILELCAGTGNVSEILAEAGYDKIHLVDISSKELAIAKKKKVLKRCKFTKADILSYKPKKRYDVVISSMGLDYFEAETEKKIFKMVKKALKVGGLFISVTLHGHTGYKGLLKRLSEGSFMVNLSPKRKHRFEYFVGRRV